MHKIVHITASRFFGGPERQMLGLAEVSAPQWSTKFVSFAENGLCANFLERAQQKGFDTIALAHDTPRLAAAQRELTALLRSLKPDLLCCHGYKANLLGLLAARRLAIPVISVSRGWTGETWRVRLYDRLDRWALKRMDRVVCVSLGQAEKVRAAGVPEDKIRVIHNAIDARRFDKPDPAARAELEAMFPQPPRFIVGAAGRLSPEKGFDVLVDAAALLEKGAGAFYWNGPEDASHKRLLTPFLSFVLFGDGAQRKLLERQITSYGLGNNFILAGFHNDLDRFFPCFDLLAIPSHTEGLPNVALEAMAASVPVVATAVGGTPEVIEDGKTGYLVMSGDAAALADRIIELASNPDCASEMGRHGRCCVEREFSFKAQAEAYQNLFSELKFQGTVPMHEGTVPIFAERSAAKMGLSPSTQPTRVCFVIDNLSRAGTESQLIMLINHLDRSKVKPYLCLLNGLAKDSRLLEPDNCPILRLGVRKLHHPATLRAAWRLIRFLRKNRIDVLQTYFPDSTYFAAPVAWVAGIRHIVLTRRNLGYSLTRRDRWFGRVVRRLATATIANCEACRRATIEQEGLAPESVFVVNNGVPIQTFESSGLSRTPANGHAWRVGMVANLRPIKGTDVFIRAASMVSNNSNAIRFLIAGEGDDQSVLRLASACGITDCLELVGRVEDVPRFLAGLDVAVLTSHSEGLSNAVLEYMAAGLPIVATAVGGNVELIEDGETGLLVPPGDPEAVARAINRLLEDRHLAARLGTAAKERVIHEYQCDDMVRRHESFYRRLLEGNS